MRDVGQSAHQKSLNRCTSRRFDRRTSGSDCRAGFTILELLVTLGVIALLMAILLPAVTSARESARRIQCADHLHQLGIAAHSYHEAFHTLPVGWQWESTQMSAYGWASSLLPYLEQQAVYRELDRSATLEDPTNMLARQTAIASFLCPSDLYDRTFVLFADTSLAQSVGEHQAQPLIELPTSSYVGVFGISEADDGIPAPPGEGSFVESRAIRFAELQRGLSNTLLVGERTMARVPSTWLGIDARGEDAACRLVGSATTTPNCRPCDECEFDSRHPGGAMFLWADGHVDLISESIDTNEYRRLSFRDHRNP